MGQAAQGLVVVVESASAMVFSVLFSDGYKTPANRLF